jgi:GTP 3',8-cyclase
MGSSVLPQVGLFAGAGITKIRLTGGEPTLRRDITELTAQLAGVPGVAHVGITTNGIALARKLPDLQAAGERRT